MKLRPHIRFALVLTCVVATACTTAPPTNSNQRNGNANAAQSNAPQTNSSAKPSQQPDQSTTGSIEVTSVPPGAVCCWCQRMSEAQANRSRKG